MSTRQYRFATRFVPLMCVLVATAALVAALTV